MSKSDQPTNLTLFLRGVEFIREYDPDAEMSVSHGFIYVGNYAEITAKMTKTEKDLMDRWGWVEGNNCWAFFYNLEDNQNDTNKVLVMLDLDLIGENFKHPVTGNIYRVLHPTEKEGVFECVLILIKLPSCLYTCVTDVVKNRVEQSLIQANLVKIEINVF